MMSCETCAQQRTLIGIGLPGVLVFPPFTAGDRTAHVVQRCDGCREYLDDDAAARALAATGRDVVYRRPHGWVTYEEEES